MQQPTNEDTREQAVHGAQRILERCLEMAADQNLLIFADETTIEVATALAEAGVRVGVAHTILFVPTVMQPHIPTAFDLSMTTQMAIREADAVVTCLTAGPECLPFRMRVLDPSWHADRRFGHMPGATMEILQLGNVDFDRLIADCQRLELALTRGRELELVSHAQDDSEHLLTVSIGGWERLSIPSDGVIPLGVWGNTPSGETYIAPIEGTASGSVVINGSLPGKVIGPGEDLILRFENGRLVAMEPEDGPSARWLNEVEINVARRKGDENWPNLAEIGIGVNPAVRALTGNMLYDEKMAGTAHVALGRNKHMGGTVESAIHCDMAIRKPTIRVDGRLVVDSGELVVSEADWRVDYRHMPLSEDLNHLDARRSGVEAKIADDGRLVRVLRPTNGRESHCYVGNDETARMTGRVYNCLPTDGTEISHSDLVLESELDADTTYQLLQVLHEYGVAHVGSGGPRC